MEKIGQYFDIFLRSGPRWPTSLQAFRSSRSSPGPRLLALSPAAFLCLSVLDLPLWEISQEGMSSLVKVEVPIKKEDSSSDEDRSRSGVEDALFCFKKFSLRLLLRRLELGLIRFFHRNGSLGILVPWMSIVHGENGFIEGEVKRESAFFVSETPGNFQNSGSNGRQLLNLHLARP